MNLENEKRFESRQRTVWTTTADATRHGAKTRLAGRAAAFGLFLSAILPVLPASASSADAGLQAVAIVEQGKQVFAFSSACNCWDSIDLLGQERVLSSKAGAQVAVAVTNVRVLGYSAETGKWQQVKLKGAEEFLSLEARGTVAVVETSLRALGFGSFRGNWAEVNFRLK